MKDREQGTGNREQRRRSAHEKRADKAPHLPSLGGCGALKKSKREVVFSLRLTTSLSGEAGFFLLPHPAGVVLVDGAELIEAVVGLDKAVAKVDPEDGGGVDAAVAEVGVAHDVAGEALAWL